MAVATFAATRCHNGGATGVRTCAGQDNDEEAIAASTRTFTGLLGGSSDFTDYLHHGDSQRSQFPDSRKLVKRFKRCPDMAREERAAMTDRRKGKNLMYRIGDSGMTAPAFFFMQSQSFPTCQRMLMAAATRPAAVFWHRPMLLAGRRGSRMN